MNNELLKLQKALHVIGTDETLREAFIALCQKVEQHLKNYSGNVREEITGPLVDALHDDTAVLRKTLHNGLLIDFYYRSRIARGFVLANPQSPDHVWEPQTTKLLIFLSRGKKQCLIGGAYFGDQALLVAQELEKSGGICHAFEPNFDQLDMLRHNAELNKINNLKAHCLGLWDEDNIPLHLVDLEDDACARSEPIVTSDEEIKTVSSVTIDTYLNENNINQLDLIVLDLEGSDYRALRGAEGQFKKTIAPNIVFEVHRHSTDWSNGLANTPIVQYITSFGYTVYAVRDFQTNYPMGEKPVELVPLDSVYLEGPPHGFNMLAFKDPALIHNKFFKICPNVSPKLLIHKDPALHHPTDGL